LAVLGFLQDVILRAARFWRFLSLALSDGRRKSERVVVVRLQRLVGPAGGVLKELRPFRVRAVPVGELQRPEQVRAERASEAWSAYRKG
jgi:hypothetical protein